MATQTERLEALLRREVVTKADLASAFDGSERTVERWTRLRVIPQPRKVGRQPIWTGRALRSYVGVEAA